MMSSNRYQRLGNDDNIPEVETEMVNVPSAPNTVQMNPIVTERNESAADVTLSVRVLFKEKSFDITGLSDATSISEFKSSIEEATTIPANLQRLIFAGKQLKPDTKLLSEF